MKPKKRIPEFRSEVEDRRFWATHDSTEYVDWGWRRLGGLPFRKSVAGSANFDQLLKSLDEAREIKAGKRKPARVITFAPAVRKKRKS